MRSLGCKGWRNRTQHERRGLLIEPGRRPPYVPAYYYIEKNGIRCMVALSPSIVLSHMVFIQVQAGMVVAPVLLRQRVDELRQDLVRHDGLRELVGVVRQATQRQRRALLDRPGSTDRERLPCSNPTEAQ